MMSSFISYFIQTIIALSIFYVLYWFLLRKETFFRFNRFYFLASMVLTLIIPLLDIGNLFVLKESTPIHVISGGYDYLQNVVLNNTIIYQSDNIGKPGIMDYLAGVYFIGVIFLFLRLVFQAVILLLKIHKARIIDISGLKVILDEKVNSPFSFFSWIFLNPSQIKGGTLSEIILHEKEHIRNKHSYDLFLIELMGIFQWVNPFVWFLRKSIKETHEYLADHAVLEQGVPVKDYQKLLLSYVFGVRNPALITPLNYSLNKKRMIMMKKMKSPNIRKWRSLLLLPVVLILSLAFTSPFSGEKNLSEQEQNQFISDSTIHFSASSLKADSLVLFILDGEEISASMLQSLDPESIESIEVIKGKSAVTKYGEKAQNGVIVITKKAILSDYNVQQYQLSGKVLNAKTDEPMPGVSIVIVNTTTGTVSDLNGEFVLQIDKGTVQVAFSFVGFETQIADVKHDNELEIRLKKGVTTLKLDQPAPISNIKSVPADHSINRNTSGEIFFIVEDMPHFPGGEQALGEYIFSHIKYPRSARKNNVSGKVFVNFTVDETGDVKNVFVDRSNKVNPDLDKEAVRIISGMPKWEPGMQRGKAVPVELSVPVEFIMK